MAVAENTQGLKWSCNTTGTTCQIPNLPCGQDYNIYVSSIDWNCIGAKSQIKLIRVGENRQSTCLTFYFWPPNLLEYSDQTSFVLSSAPCVPDNVQTNLDCLSGVLNISWQSTGYFVQFYASVVSSKGQVSSCETDSLNCVINGLQCDTTYSVTVMAQNEICNSSLSPTKQVTTGDCFGKPRYDEEDDLFKYKVSKKFNL